MCFECCLSCKFIYLNLIHMLLVFTFFLDKKGNQKIKENTIAPRVFPGPAPPLCLRCIFYIEAIVLANNCAGAILMDTHYVSGVAFGIGC